MTPLSLLFAVALGAYLYLAVIVIGRNPRSPLNMICGFFLLCFALWAFEDVFHNLQPAISSTQAQVYGNLGSTGGYCFPSFFMVFVLILTRQRRALRAWPIYLALAGIPLLLVVTQWAGVGTVTYERGPFGWIDNWSSSPLTILYYLFYVGLTLTGLVLLFRFRNQARRVREQHQATIIAYATLITLVLGSITDVVLPRMNVHFPEVAGALALIWAAGLFVGITRYGMLSLTAETAANEILATMRDSLFLLSPEGTIVTTNRASRELLGYDRTEFVGCPAASFFQPTAQFGQAMNRVLNEGEIVRQELTGRTRDGRLLPVSASARLMRDQDGSLVGSVWVVRDVTDLWAAEQSLRESEEKYRELVERANDGIVIIQDAIVQYANQRMCEMNGSTMEEIIGTPLSSHIHPDALADNVARYHRRMAGQPVPSVYETALKRRDGGKVLAELNAGVITYRGRPADLVFVRDVTERKRAESAVLESEEKYRNLVERANDGIVIIQDSLVKFANRRMVEMVGRGLGEILGTPFADYMHPDYLPQAINRYRCRLAGEPLSPTWEAVLKRPDGTRLEAELNAGMVTYEGQSADMVFVRDITERKQAEAAVRESEERFRKVFSNAPIGMALSDMRGAERRFTKANPAFGDMLGYSEQELTGLSFLDITHPDDVEESKQLVGQMLKGEIPGFQTDKRYVTKDGRAIWGRATVTLLRDEMVGLAMIESISERKEAEEKIQATLTELARSNAELEQFAYAASHDLQEPLRTIAGYVKLLQRRYEGRLDRDAQDFITYAVDGVARMQRLIDDLLTYARVGTRAKPFAPFAAGSALRTAMANLQMKIRDTGATITGDDLPIVFGDESQVAQLFQNLIDNALKFHGPEPPRVEASAGRKGGRWIFAVRDNGIGIDPKYFDRIFKIFQRLHTIDQYPGSGIGLAVCERIVRRHGGAIWVESEAGKGTTFHFTLPCEPQ